MKTPRIGARLACAAGLVRQGAYLADVGTDHAFLPLFLLSSGKISRAVCSDINAGPLNSARENAREADLADRIEFRLCNGAASLSGLGITDYAVCGMGGELIASIIDAAGQTRCAGVHLILGPNSRQGYLRRYLCASGFEILSEVYSFDAGKYYLTLLAEYTGNIFELDPITAEVGWIMSENDNRSCHIGYIKGKITAYKTALLGKEKGGADTSFEEEVLSRLNEKLLDLEK